MHPFSYTQGRQPGRCRRRRRAAVDAYVAGGTTLVDLMRETVERPEALIDISALPLRDITRHRAAGACASARWRRWPRLPPTHVSEPPSRRLAGPGTERFAPSCETWPPSAATSCSAPAAPTSETYSAPCNKREPGSGCAALEGYNRTHAILGTSDGLRGHPPFRPCRGLRRTGRRGSPARTVSGRRQVAFADFLLQAGQHARARTRPAGRRTDHRGGDPGPAPSAAVGLPEGPRPAVLRVRTDLRRRRAAIRDGVIRRRRSPPAGWAPCRGGCRAVEQRPDRASARHPNCGAPLPNMPPTAPTPRTQRASRSSCSSARSSVSCESWENGDESPARRWPSARRTPACRRPAQGHRPGDVRRRPRTRSRHRRRRARGRWSTAASAAAESPASTPRAPMAEPGVLSVISHHNAPTLPYRGQRRGSYNPPGVRLRVFQDDQVHFFGQPVAVVVADHVGGRPARGTPGRGHLRRRTARPPT